MIGLWMSLGLVDKRYSQKVCGRNKPECQLFGLGTIDKVNSSSVLYADSWCKGSTSETKHFYIANNEKNDIFIINPKKESVPSFKVKKFQGLMS